MPTPGSIVRCRDRTWVLLPSWDDDRMLLRPLSGWGDDVVAISRVVSDMLAHDLPTERVGDAQFPLPTAAVVQDAQAIRLLWQATRMAVRDSTAPLRSLGWIAFRPHGYQIVPVLMALRLHPVRMLIADASGVGKTIEALLIARELWDRGAIRRLAVICPPALCDQWQQEMQQKFHLDAEIIRPRTIARLERWSSIGRETYSSVLVISHECTTTAHHRARVLSFNPDLVIVDEAHRMVAATDPGSQVHDDLVRDLAAHATRHLVVLTPPLHTILPTTVNTLIGVLDPAFAAWDVRHLTDEQRSRLARHVIQRTRAEIEHGETGGLRSFPHREVREAFYRGTPAYDALVRDVITVSIDLIRSDAGMDESHRRLRTWAALTLVRCVMSSPAAAAMALRPTVERQATDHAVPLDTARWQAMVTETDSGAPDDDDIPTAVLAQAVMTMPTRDRRRLSALATRATQIIRHDQDAKLHGVIDLICRLIDDGYAPIIWCRYAVTAAYVAQAIRRQCPDYHVTLAIGRMGVEAHRAVIAAAPRDRPRVLVTTDCLSVGVNLHERYHAAIHYDLPWNPHHLEQRDGRIDRYGQQAPTVVTVRYTDVAHAVDRVMRDLVEYTIDALHRSRDPHVSVSSDQIADALAQALVVHRSVQAHQALLDLAAPVPQGGCRCSNEAGNQDRPPWIRLAPPPLTPDDGQAILDAADRVLGNPDAVRDFVVTAAGRLNLRVRPSPHHPDVLLIDATSTTPAAVRDALPVQPGLWAIGFCSPTPPGADYIGRTHRLVHTLSRYLGDTALAQHRHCSGTPPVVARVGVIHTAAVDRLTVVLLTRSRYLLTLPTQQYPLLAEDVLLGGVVGVHETPQHWLSHDEALHLMTTAHPATDRAPTDMQDLVTLVLTKLDPVTRDNPIWQEMYRQIDHRAADLGRTFCDGWRMIQESGQGMTVAPVMPPDLIGLLVLSPAM